MLRIECASACGLRMRACVRARFCMPACCESAQAGSPSPSPWLPAALPTQQPVTIIIIAVTSLHHGHHELQCGQRGHQFNTDIVIVVYHDQPKYVWPSSAASPRIKGLAVLVSTAPLFHAQIINLAGATAPIHTHMPPTKAHTKNTDTLRANARALRDAAHARHERTDWLQASPTLTATHTKH